MAIRAGNVDRLALLVRALTIAHQSNTGVTIDTTHARQVVDIGGFSLNGTAIRQSQPGMIDGSRGLFDLCKSCVAQRDTAGTGVTAEAPRVRHIGCQCGVSAVRVVIDMTSEAAATTIPHDVQFMLRFFLSQVTTRALFPQQRVGNTVAQRLEVRRFFRTAGAVDQLPGYSNDAATGVHQVVAHGDDLVGVATAAGTHRGIQRARESDQSGVGAGLGIGGVVAGVTAYAVACRERMTGIETLTFR